ncbi:MAG: hypothetical protein ACLTDM_15210 [Clostridium butyricum]
MFDINFKKITLKEFNERYRLNLKYKEDNLENFFDFLTEELNNTKSLSFFSSLDADDVIQDYYEVLQGKYSMIEFIEVNGVYLVVY